MRSDDIEAAAMVWIASEVDAYPGETMDDRIASWMRGGVHPDDVSRFLVDAYVEGYRAALARPRETTDAEAVRHAAAEIARAGAVAAYEAMAAAPRDGAQQYTRADVMEAVGDSLSKCESMIRALPLPARDDAVVEARALEDRIVDLRLTLAHIAHGGVLRDPEDGGVETAIRWADNALKADDKADDAAERGASVADGTVRS